MCGIVGISGSNINISSIKNANSVIFHRGPDDGGIYINQALTIGLGHRRLSIIDTSSFGHQPMLSADETVAIVFNGEIYNYKTLRADLVKKGFIFVMYSSL